MRANLIKEHDSVVITRDLPAHGLVAGDTGVVVHIHAPPDSDQPDWYLLEIFALDGSTIEVIEAPADAVRPAGSNEIPHARPVAAE
jgi:hypothetical protein